MGNSTKGVIRIIHDNGNQEWSHDGKVIARIQATGDALFSHNPKAPHEALIITGEGVVRSPVPMTTSMVSLETFVTAYMDASGYGEPTIIRKED